MTSQTHVASGALFTAAGLGAANAAGWMHTPVWALAVGIAWGAIAGELPDIDHPKARVSRTGVAFGVAGRVLGLPARIVGVFVRGFRVTHRGPTHSLAFLALWAAIAAPLYVAYGGVVLVALAWVVGKLAAVSHTGLHLKAPMSSPLLVRMVARGHRSPSRMPLRGSLALGPVGPFLTARSRARLCSEKGLGG